MTRTIGDVDRERRQWRGLAWMGWMCATALACWCISQLGKLPLVCPPPPVIATTQEAADRTGGISKEEWLMHRKVDSEVEQAFYRDEALLAKDAAWHRWHDAFLREYHGRLVIEGGK